MLMYARNRRAVTLNLAIGQGENSQTQTQTQQGGNPARGVAGQLGVQSHSQEMTIPDPRTGQRVLINSPEGMARSCI